MDAKSGTGTTKNVSLVPPTLSSTKITPVFPSVISANNTMLKDFVCPATSDMISNLDHASSLKTTMPDLLISDVLIGIGTTINVSPVLTGISSMLMEPVLQSAISAKPMMELVEVALNASKDFQTIMEFVNPQIQSNPQISDVDHGTGTTKPVSLALKTGFLSTELVSPSTINAQLSMKIQEIASHATSDTTLKEENVLFKI